MIILINFHTTKISEYVDYHLQPIVKEIPSYIQDTTNFLRKVNQSDFVPDNSYLVSLVVKSLYTNIPNAEGIKSVKRSLGKYSKQTASTKVITTFLALILTLYFQLQKLLTGKRLHHGNNLCTLICKHLYRPL